MREHEEMPAIDLQLPRGEVPYLVVTLKHFPNDVWKAHLRVQSMVTLVAVVIGKRGIIFYT